MNINALAGTKRNVIHIRSYIDQIGSNLPGANFAKRLYNYICRPCRENTSLMRMLVNTNILIELLVISQTYPPFDVILDHVPIHCNYILMKTLCARQLDNISIILCCTRTCTRCPAENSKCEVCTDMSNTSNTTSGITSSLNR